LWQVEARSNASFNAYRRLDLHYVENWSLALDLRILLGTIEQIAVLVVTLPLRPILGKRGTLSSDSVTIRTLPTHVPSSESRSTAPEPIGSSFTGRMR
jgi:hypothetical protein